MKRKSGISQSVIAEASAEIQNALARGYLMDPEDNCTNGRWWEFLRVCSKEWLTSIVIRRPERKIRRIECRAATHTQYSFLVQTAEKRCMVERADPRFGCLWAAVTANSAESIAAALAKCNRLRRPDFWTVLRPASTTVTLEIVTPCVRHLPNTDLNWAIMRHIKAGKIRVVNLGQGEQVFGSSGPVEEVEVFVRRFDRFPSEERIQLKAFAQGKIYFKVRLSVDGYPELVWRNAEVLMVNASTHVQ